MLCGSSSPKHKTLPIRTNGLNMSCLNTFGSRMKMEQTIIIPTTAINIPLKLMTERSGFTTWNIVNTLVITPALIAADFPPFVK